jgi:toxin ParE1/3/4
MPSRYSVQLSSSAENDVLRIGRYIAEHSDLETALRIMDGLDACWNKLSHFPNRGNMPKELVAMGRRDIRELRYKHYRIFYRVEGSRVMVHAIVDGRRNIAEFLMRRLQYFD